MNFLGELPSGVKLLESGRVYFVGIKGVGMTALAVLLAQAGVPVAGADTTESFVTDAQLIAAGIEVQSFEIAQLGDAKIVVYSGAHKGFSQPLVVEARARGLVCLTHAQAVGLLSQEKETIGVCGVGGKSTTSALMAHILQTAGQKPSYAVGVGTVPNLGGSGHWQPDTRSFVVEADEYVADPLHDVTPRFLYLRPTHAIATSLRFDHPDVYTSLEDTKKAFSSFFSLLPESGFLVINGDDEGLLDCCADANAQVVTVGEGSDNDVILSFMAPENGLGKVQLSAPGFPCDGWELEMSIPGQHNLRNGAFAAVLSSLLGVEKSAVLSANASFLSTPRRFEYRGENAHGAKFYDDYAHHPHELVAVSEALDQWFGQLQKVLVFQPHTYSRTKALLESFADAMAAFSGEVILMPIFASARESDDPTVSSEQLVREIIARGGKARFIQTPEELVEYFRDLPGKTIALTAGAGDIYKVYDKLDLSITE